jgi:hypothetical protein
MRREDGHTKWIKMMTVTTDLSGRSLEASFHPQERSASDSADKIVDFILYQDLTRFWPIGQTIKIPRPSQLFQRGCPVFIFHLWNLEGVYVTCVQTLKNHSPVRVKVWASKDLSFKTLNLGNQSHVRKILEESSFNKSNLIMKTSLYLAFHSLLSCHTWKTQHVFGWQSGGLTGRANLTNECRGVPAVGWFCTLALCVPMFTYRLPTRSDTTCSGQVPPRRWIDRYVHWTQVVYIGKDIRGLSMFGIKPWQ